MFKDILVYLDGHPGHEACLKLAVSIARMNDARLNGLYGFMLPRVVQTNLATGTYAQSSLLQETYERERDTAFITAAQIEGSFRAAAKTAGISTEWRLCAEKPADIVTLVTERARYCDLAVLGQAGPDHPLFDSLAGLPEAVMLGCGRPVLIVPYVGSKENVGRKVLVAWNGTREAARAVGDAMPLLRSAEDVTVVTIGPAHQGESEDGPSAARLARHLVQHRVRAQTTHLVSHDTEAGALILSRAADLDCDLIVMGGYGHSRTRELLLGGVTRAVLQHMTVPVLMSH